MKNFIQEGINLSILAPTAVASGGVVIAGEIVGVAAGAAATGAPVDVVTRGVFELPKVATDTFAVGAPVYFDTATGLVTSTAAGNTRIGVAVSVAVNPSGTVYVRLSGAF